MSDPDRVLPRQVVRAVPFTFRRRIAWGDSDTGRIVYTGRFLDFVMDAADAWWQVLTGHDWHRMTVEHGHGLPAVHVDMDFTRVIEPGEELDCVVTVVRLGTSSFSLAVSGETANGQCFTATLVQAYMNTARRKAVPLPEHLRKLVEDYQQACRTATLPA